MSKIWCVDMTELTVFLTLLVIVVACVMMLLPEDTKGDKVAEIQDKKLIDIRNKEISCIIDSIQLLLSECPLHIKYIMDIHDITVEINNMYIYAGAFDMELLNKLLHSWISS